MSIQGVSFTLKIEVQIDDFHELVDSVYDSFATNPQFVAIDLASNEDKHELAFLIGVECPTGLDAESLAVGLIEDAVDRAMSSVGLSGPSEDGEVSQTPVLVSALTFA
ncbi:MAG: hypothetical protein WBA28_04905 [Microbacteriaceae bacterium]